MPLIQIQQDMYLSPKKKKEKETIKYVIGTALLCQIICRYLNYFLSYYIN